MRCCQKKWPDDNGAVVGGVKFINSRKQNAKKETASPASRPKRMRRKQSPHYPHRPALASTMGIGADARDRDR